MAITSHEMITSSPTLANHSEPQNNLWIVGSKRKLDEVVGHGTSSHSDDDSVALLPRHTVVKILGNARTKAALIGQQAIVKRAVGLGGWHWLTLDSGEEVKLQRNALAVIEYPTGQEHDSSLSEEEEQHHHPHGLYHHAAPTTRPDLLKYQDFGRHKRVPRPPVPFTAEDYNGQKRTHTVKQPSGPSRINFGKLDTASLRRCGDYYHLPVAAQGVNNRDTLLSAVSDNFASQEVDEGVVIAHFLAAARRHSMGLAAYPRA